MKNKRTISIALITICFILLFNVQAQALSISKYYMPSGGKWQYNGQTDYDITKSFTEADWRTKEIVEYVNFIPPEAVKQMQLALSYSVGVDKTKEYIKLGVDFAVSGGIDYAKNKLIEKLGENLAMKFIPWLSAFSWGRTAYDVLSTIAEGQELVRLTTASQRGVGLIYKNSVVSGWSTSQWYYWDDSSTFGSYPYANLGPNNFQYGNIKINDGWYSENSKWYYIDSNAQFATGWRQINGNWYFFQPVATQTMKLGQMATDWQSINGEMYYFGSDGIMKTDTWVQSPTTSKWYYVGSDGAMLTGWKQLDGKWFFLNDNVTRDDGVIGAMLVSWQIIDGKWYYFHTTTTGTVVKGEMATGWIQPDGYYYYLYPTTTGTVVKGQMAVGWTQINGEWYYFYSNGRMAVNTTIDGYRLGSDGAMI